jgi:polysaccharide biosynthesis transport protein
LAAKLGLSLQQAVTVSSLSQSPEIQDLLIKIQQTQTQLISERNRFTETHPAVINLERNLADLKQIFAEKSAKISRSGAEVDPDSLVGKLQQDFTAELVRLEAQRKGSQEEATALSETLKSYQEQVATLPRLEQQQHELERQLDVAQKSYSTLLQQYQDTQLASNQKQGSARIVAEATIPDRPSAPRKPLYVATGLIFGAVLAFLTLYGLEALNKSLRTVEEIRQRLNLPILGVIPLLGRGIKFSHRAKVQEAVPRLYLIDLPNHKVSEAYRLLQSNLQTLGEERPCHVLAITSTLAREGKSTVVANLAIALAESGRSAILVEANFQDPVQQNIWSRPVALGLSEVLTNQVSWHFTVQRIYPNLDLMLSGKVESQAISSLDSRQMTVLLTELSERYDFVLLDTPALETGADAVRLSQVVDGILLVAQPGRIDADSATFAQQVLSQSRQSVLGLILNQVQPIHEPYPYYYLAPEQSSGRSISSVASVRTGASPFAKSGDRSGLDLTVADLAGLNFELPSNRSTEETLEQMPLDQLQFTVEALQKDWLRSARLVREQEEELNLQSQTVREMHEKLQTAGEYHRHAASQYERLSLEVQLVDEEERKRLLDETLVGQRRRVLQQQEIVRHHLKILQQRAKNEQERGNCLGT